MKRACRVTILCVCVCVCVCCVSVQCVCTCVLKYGMRRHTRAIDRTHSFRDPRTSAHQDILLSADHADSVTQSLVDLTPPHQLDGRVGIDVEPLLELVRSWVSAVHLRQGNTVPTQRNRNLAVHLSTTHAKPSHSSVCVCVCVCVGPEYHIHHTTDRRKTFAVVTPRREPTCAAQKITASSTPLKGIAGKGVL